MKLAYFADTDTLYIGLGEGPSEEVIDVTPNLIVDLGKNGIPMGITIEHAAERYDLSALQLDGLSFGAAARKAA